MPIDISAFPAGGPEISYDDEDIAGLEAVKAEACAHLASWASAPPIAQALLAFGVAPMVGVFLVRFAAPIQRGDLAGASEMRAVGGDLPPMCFETDDAPTPADALRLYCAIAEDWAQTALSGGDLSQCYPVRVEPSQEHAQMLLRRIAFVREELVPLA
jgi:hypothetical protein